MKKAQSSYCGIQDYFQNGQCMKNAYWKEGERGLR